MREHILIHLCNTPSECCPFIKTFSYICKSGGFKPSDITYCESVFRKSANENVEVFSTGWTIRNNTHFRIDTCGRSRSAYPYPISIRVWGIVSFIAIGSYHNLLLDKRKSAPHFLFVSYPLRSLGGTSIDNRCMIKLNYESPQMELW